MYLINKKVYFIPNDNFLINIKNKERVVIFSPASLCFLHLIERKGQIVPQTDLLSIGWGEQAKETSYNTFYQTILNLRNGIEAAGLDKSVLKTIRGKGLELSNELEIEHFKYENIGLTEIFDKGFPPIEHKGSLSASEQPLPKKSGGGTLSRYQTGLFLFIFLCAAVVSWCYTGISIPSFSFAKYQEIKSVGDCRVFRNPSLQKDSDYTEMLMRNGFTCGDEKWWYITNNVPSVRFSVFMCRDALNNKMNNVAYCESHYFLGMKYNEND